jgi:hypothetical protein
VGEYYVPKNLEMVLTFQRLASSLGVEIKEKVFPEDKTDSGEEFST